MFIFIFKQIKMSWQNLFRNFWLSLATIMVIILALFSINLLFGLKAVSEQAMGFIREKINISVYFKSEVGQKEMEKMRQDLLNLSVIEEIKFVSKEQAMIQFKERHQDNSILLKSLGELKENPLNDSLVIRAKNMDDYPQILSFLEKPDYENLIWSRKFNEDYKNTINQLNQIAQKLQLVMLGIITLFIFISILIVINTIRIGTYTYKEEIEIMRLVGATNRFIRAPFLWQTAFYTIAAWLIHLAIFFPILSLVNPYISSFLGSTQFNLTFYFKAHFLLIFGWELLGILMINLLTSAIAMRKYLKI